MKRIKQINNLVIKLDDAPNMNYFGTKQNNPLYNTYSVWHSNICLEDRLTLEQAIGFATDTKDFVKKAA